MGTEIKKLFIIIFIFCLVAFSQSNIRRDSIAYIPNTQFRNVLLSLNATGSICYRVFERQTNVYDPLINIKDTSDYSLFNFWIGFAMIYQFNKNIGLETGLDIAFNGYYDTYIDRGANFYINFPFKLRLAAGNKKARFVYGAGIVVNNALYKSTLNERTTLNVFGIYFAGLELRFNEADIIRFEPFYMHQFTNNLKSNDYLERTWNIGLKFSYSFSFYNIFGPRRIKNVN